MYFFEDNKWANLTLTIASNIVLFILLIFSIIIMFKKLTGIEIPITIKSFSLIFIFLFICKCFADIYRDFLKDISEELLRK